MAKQDEDALSPTVMKVLDEFVSAMRGDEAISRNAIDRLEELLRKGRAPKPEEIGRAVFLRADNETK